ncbi:MAG: hypothetical protein WCE21_03730 [Candidatus Babeliales bacterium]
MNSIKLLFFTCITLLSVGSYPNNVLGMSQRNVSGNNKEKVVSTVTGVLTLCEPGQLGVYCTITRGGTGEVLSQNPWYTTPLNDSTIRETLKAFKQLLEQHNYKAQEPIKAKLVIKYPSIEKYNKQIIPIVYAHSWESQDSYASIEKAIEGIRDLAHKPEVEEFIRNDIFITK